MEPSGYTDASIVDESAMRNQPFIQKPFTPQSLVRAVRDAIEARAKPTD